LRNFFCTLTDQAKYVPSNVALEAADRLQLGVTFSNAAGDIGLRTRISAKPSNGNDVQCAVSGSIATAIQAMPRDLARGGRHWTDAA